MGLEQERYIRFTTFRRDGTPVSTPAWIVELDGGRFGFWTSSGSGKAKRLAHTSRVIVQPSDPRGRPKPGSEPLEATAELVTGREHEEIRRRVIAKYGKVQTTITRSLGTIGGILKGRRIPYGDRGVVITLSGAGTSQEPAPTATAGA